MCLTKRRYHECILYFEASGSGFDGSVAVDDPSTHNRRHDFSRKLPPVKGRVLRLGKRLCSLKGPPLLRIEEGDVTKVAAAKRPPSSQVEAARRTGCKQLDHPSQWNVLRLMQLGNRQCQRSFQPSNAESGALEFHFL